MNTKRIIGIVLMLLGIGAFFVSNYITTQVKEGKLKIAKGQKTVDQSNKLFSMNPTAKQVGKGLTAPAQKKINKGKEDVRDYEAIAKNIFLGGVIIFVIGAGTFAISFMGNKKNRRK